MPGLPKSDLSEVNKLTPQQAVHLININMFPPLFPCWLVNL